MTTSKPIRKMMPIVPPMNFSMIVSFLSKACLMESAAAKPLDVPSMRAQDKRNKNFRNGVPA
jgi:hypothetical protein